MKNLCGFQLAQSSARAVNWWRSEPGARVWRVRVWLSRALERLANWLEPV